MYAYTTCAVNVMRLAHATGWTEVIASGLYAERFSQAIAVALMGMPMG